MLRVVLVGWAEDDWRIYRQLQWIGQVRRRPDAATRPRRHFDIAEEAYQACRDEWTQGAAGASAGAALDCLARHGAVEVRLP
ncbi:MAG TPA: hypothetical protein VF590_11555 [Isosphaeraceae bacterium]